MPTARIPSLEGPVDLYYEETGQGFPLPLVEQQVRYFSRRYRVVTWNYRGYPPSEVPKDPDAYSVEILVEESARAPRAPWQFFADTRATIRTRGVPSGLAEIREYLEKLLRNPDLLKKHLGDPVPHVERTTIGHDPETDVHVLVHGRAKAGKSAVHDHGPCWVIYGNYKNPTRMRRWRRVDDGTRPGHAEVELQKEFLNEPGHAAVFAVGDIHSIEFGDDTFFIRVTGGDVETKKTLKFDPDKKTVEVADRALNQR